MNKTKKYKAVVIGSSAGGLAVLTSLLEKLPTDYPLPVMIVQHRSKDHNELLESVLQERCQIKIKQADDKEDILKGHVYLAPPDYHLLVNSDQTFSLSVDEPVQFSRPSISVLFESAAEVYRDQLVGIILTGTSSDGSGGMRSIKQMGGTTIAQDPAEASYSYMPAASIETGSIDEIWRIEKIKHFLLNQI